MLRGLDCSRSCRSTPALSASGTIHPILARLEGIGWLESRWEEIDPRVEGRPARRCYRLTPDGIQPARGALARAYSASAGPAWLRPQGEQP
jgi:PadR family transcriptional regulator PadR